MNTQASGSIQWLFGARTTPWAVLVGSEGTILALGDDLNCPVLLGYLFDGIRIVNAIHDGKAMITSQDLQLLQSMMHTFVFDLLGLKQEEEGSPDERRLLNGVIELLLQQRQEAKARKDYTASDNIRNQLSSMGIAVKDTKDGAEWEFELK